LGRQSLDDPNGAVGSWLARKRAAYPRGVSCDVNLDGKINIDDYVLIDSLIGTQGPL